MKKALFISILILFNASWLSSQDYISSLETPLSFKISNNAVTGGYLNGIPHVFSFCGIDSTKVYTGINLKGFRYNTATHVWDTIPDLPDSRGKIAAGASCIDSVIYIIGGYHVDRFGNEVSSNKIHRYNINTNSYLTDGTNIPIATDDHVQAVWNDSLIFVITGWSNTGNIPNVQIYNPKQDTWLVGTSVPNSHTYTSFGASGTIIRNTIYYYGGASSASGFNIQNILRIGEINPTNPAIISWNDTIIDPSISCYRAACVSSPAGINWLGGSEVTYNYNGIAYNGSGGVNATGRNIYYNPTDSTLNYKYIYGDSIPMDLRGIADFGNTKYLVGGMINNQQVTNKVWKLSFQLVEIKDSKKLDFEIYPNPSNGLIQFKKNNSTPFWVSIYSINGEKIIESQLVSTSEKLDLSRLKKGIYLVILKDGDKLIQRKLVLY